MDTKNWSVETARTLHTGKVVDLHSIINADSALERIAEVAGTSSTNGVPLRAAKIIPFAAEKYNISANLKDYVVQPVIIMPSDLPNRNKVAFPLRRLSEFLPEIGCLGYETWRYMPCFRDHNNSDWTQAKGIVLDVGIRPMPNAKGNLWKVNALLAFDRSRDPELANKILEGDSSYSMGALVSNYNCAVCGSEVTRKDRPTCEHFNIPDNPKFDTFIVNGKRRLAHWNVGSFKGFEVSYVDVPAYSSALGGELVWS